MRLNRITPADLNGRHAISYFRFSSAPQEKGSTIDRQQETLDRVIATYGLILDDSLTDRALSASKGYHRKRGKLGDLLKAVSAGQIARGTVLVVEAMDRLFREGVLDVFPELAKLIHGGIVLVVGRDMTIYCETAINGDLSHKLVAEINAARDYAQRLSEYATGAHAKRRQRVADFALDPSKPPPNLNGIVPAWIVRTKGQNDYRLHPVHTATVKRIFKMCGNGASVRQISETLNREKVPLFPGTLSWRAPRIGAILRDRHVLGYYTPTRLNPNTKKRDPIGPEAKVLPAAVDAAEWVRACEALESRRVLVGRRGNTVPNLFTGKARCASCGGAMRVDTGGGIRKGKRQRSMLCASYVEKSGCNDKTRYDLDLYEPLILMALLRLTSIAPKSPTADLTKVMDEIASIRIESEQKETAVKSLIPLIHGSPTLAQTVATLSVEIDLLKRKIADLTVLSEASPSLKNRTQDMWDFVQALVRPAVAGDVDARDSLRTLLTKMDYLIVGDPVLGGLVVSSPNGSEHIYSKLTDYGPGEEPLVTLRRMGDFMILTAPLSDAPVKFRPYDPNLRP